MEDQFYTVPPHCDRQVSSIPSRPIATARSVLYRPALLRPPGQFYTVPPYCEWKVSSIPSRLIANERSNRWSVCCSQCAMCIYLVTGRSQLLIAIDLYLVKVKLKIDLMVKVRLHVVRPRH